MHDALALSYAWHSLTYSNENMQSNKTMLADMAGDIQIEQLPGGHVREACCLAWRGAHSCHVKNCIHQRLWLLPQWYQDNNPILDQPATVLASARCRHEFATAGLEGT